jgi:phospholipid/cholesterol/gamma-HCH transport system substrate-binding protein
MKLRFKYTDKIVGIFVFASILLLLAIIFLIILNQKLFIKKYDFTSKFDDASDVKVNQDIFFKGFKIGKISDVNLNEKNEVEVKFFIYEDFHDRIKKDSVLNKASNPITGGKIVLIQNETTKELAKDHSYIPSLDTDEGQALLQKGIVSKQSDTVSNLFDQVGSILGTVDDLLKSINTDQNPDKNSIARILVNTADSVQLVKKELGKVDSIVDQVPGMMDKVPVMMENVDGSLAKVNDSMTKVNEILDNFKELSSEMKNPDGMVRRLIDPNGEVMFNSIEKSLNSLTEIMDELSKFTFFINGEQKQIETLLIESKNTMKDARDVIEGIKNNPLIKGGITDKKTQEKVKESVREKDFK